MSEKNPNIQIPVDLTNPGQFFACCGLLELADRLWPQGEVIGSFQIHRFDRATFRINATTTFTSQDIIEILLKCQPKPVDPFQPIWGSNAKPVDDPEKIRPIMIASPLNLRLSWWLDELAGVQTAFKTWSAHPTSLSLFKDAAKAIDPKYTVDKKLFSTPVGMKGRYGFDPRSSWDTLNTGYSPNDQGEKVDSYPATELLAAIGLQTFLPASFKGSYQFTPWEHSLPLIAARIAASGGVNISDTQPYTFSILSRGRFKNFSKAKLVTRSSHV